MAQILTINEVRRALYVDFDYDEEELMHYAQAATSFLLEKTGHNWAEDKIIEPLAKQCAILYCRQQYFGANDYNREHDYSIGITGLLVDLQNMASKKKEEA